MGRPGVNGKIKSLVVRKSQVDSKVAERPEAKDLKSKFEDKVLNQSFFGKSKTLMRLLHGSQKQPVLFAMETEG